MYPPTSITAPRRGLRAAAALVAAAAVSVLGGCAETNVLPDGCDALTCGANATAAGGRDIFQVVRGADGSIFATTVADDFDGGLTVVPVTPIDDGMWQFGAPLHEGNVWDVVPHAGRLYIAERNLQRAALYTIDASSGAELAPPHPSGLPPEQLTPFHREGGCW